MAPDLVAGQIWRAVRQLTHRGPDDEGVDMASAVAPLVVFGHRRLAILDLTPAGHQPMRDPVSGNWITYNGEIYNFRELRAELEARGHAFASAGDTEVILKAYAEWGVGCWRRLRGIFAFGLWDARFRELHLVRDPLGVKPLYFARTAGGVVFASEVRAILAGDWVERKLSGDGLRSFLKYGSIQEPTTLVSGIESLPPGHYLTRTADGAISVRHFWSAEETLARNWETPPTAGGVLGRLQASVAIQMVADVPVGVFLSGGIDSMTVAALAARARPGAVRTFCIGTDEKESDESVEAANTAGILKCEHATLRLEGRLVRERLSAALASYDQPSHDGINTYFISMLVRQAGIKVALSGLGGDELFAGYGAFEKARKLERLGERIGQLPASWRDRITHGVAARTPAGSAMWGGLAELTSSELTAPYFASRILFSRAHSERLIEGVTAGEHVVSAWERREAALAGASGGLADVNRVSFFELQTYLLSTLLRDADQMSMAHGLELRVPLIDPELVEYVLPISGDEKTRGGVAKRLLIDALSGVVPPEMLAHRKRGFTLPFDRWLQNDLREAVGDVFVSSELAGPWNRERFRGVWADFSRHRVSWSRVLTLFVLETWLRANRISA